MTKDDQFETFIKIVREKCLYSSANLLELVGEKENEYVVNFQYNDSEERLESKPIKKDQLFEFLGKVQKHFVTTIAYIWNCKNSPLCNQLGYFAVDDWDENIRLDLMSNVEFLNSCGLTYIKCNALFFKGNRVIFHEADKFYKIVAYRNSSCDFNIKTGLTLCNTLYNAKTYKLNCGNEERITSLRHENSNLFMGMMFFFCLGLSILFGSFGYIDYLEKQHEKTNIQHINLVGDLRAQITNLTLARDNAIIELNETQIMIEKNNFEISELAKEKRVDTSAQAFIVFLCFIVCTVVYSDIKKFIKIISLDSNDKQNKDKNKNKNKDKNKDKKIDLKQPKKSYPIVTKLNTLKEKPKHRH